MTPNNELIPLLPEKIVSTVKYDSLPSDWVPTDLQRFSNQKSLYEYQQNALINCIKWLYLYFGESNSASSPKLKQKWFDQMKGALQLSTSNVNQLESLGFDSSKNRRLFDILREYYPTEARISKGIESEYIPFFNYVNRVGFWMATGSGKSLVLIKLIEILDEYIQCGLLGTKTAEENYDILVLSYREDLLRQLRTLIVEYNQGRDRQIIVWDLKEYDRVKSGQVLVDTTSINIFMYRSDLISDVTTEANISFEDIDNNGRWIILLDEAHKGDSEESKRQQYYSILSRNGLLFNFSATFTDPWDVITTVFNFNLSEFTRAGYGKNVYLMHDESVLDLQKEMDMREKRALLLQMLVLFCYTKQCRDAVLEINPALEYHNPLLVILGKTVNIKEADLEIIFRLLEEVAVGRVATEELAYAKKTLVKRFEHHQSYCFSDEQFLFDRSMIMSIGIETILDQVFHSTTHGVIEVIRNPTDGKQIVFKLKTSDVPFALLKIGDVTTWLKEKLSGYEIIETFDDRSYFDELDSEKSPVNILLGAQAFYEGWDSNRPNIMAFINIGKSDAKKYVLQAIGRGVRIEPVKNKRKRLAFLSEFRKMFSSRSHPKPEILAPIETLFIFGTNETNIERLLEGIRFVEPKESRLLTLKENPVRSQLNLPLLIPVYSSPRAAVSIKDFPKFKGNKHLLQEFLKWLDDDVILYALLCRLCSEDISPSVLKKIKSFIQDGAFATTSRRDLLRQLYDLARLVQIKLEALEKYKELDNEIVHFKLVSTTLDANEVQTLQEIINRVGSFTDPESEKSRLIQEFQDGTIDKSEFQQRYDEVSKIRHEERFYSIRIKQIVSHYYLPILLSENGKGQYIKHIIRVPSEREFIDELENILQQSNNPFSEVGQWMFSKIVEKVDEIYIPYFSAVHKSIRRYFPDFIFWFKNGSRYYILFVDPKGPVHTDYQEKIDGYLQVFWDGDKPKICKHDSLVISVHLRMYCKDRSQIPKEYRKFWMDDIRQIREILTE